jgi:hypothetical protein
MTDAYLPTLEPDENAVPQTVLPVEPTIADLYAVIVDIHRMEAEKLAIIRGVATMANQFGEQIPEFMATLQDSPIFGILSGSGGGLLGSLFRR